MPRTKHIINIHTSTGTSEPLNANLLLGEIAVQHTPDNPALWIKMGTSEESTDYEKFIGENEIYEILATSAASLQDLAILSAAVVTISGQTGGGADVAPLSAAVISLSAGVKDNEYVAAAAINYLNDRINELSGNTGAGAEPLSAAVISLSGVVANVSGSVTNLSAATTGISQKLNTLSGAAHTKITNVSGAVVSLSASVVGDSQKITTVSGAVESLSGAVESTITGVTLNGNSATVTNRVAELTSSVIYAGTQMPEPSLGNNGDVYLQADSVVLYETDGTTGLLGINSTASSLSNNWQLEDMDFTPYRYIKCYFKASSGVNNTAFTPAVIVTVQLDSASLGTTAYIGGTMCVLPFNKNREYTVSCAVDSTKTKFQVIQQDTLWDISSSDANSDGRYLYKIEGYI